MVYFWLDILKEKFKKYGNVWKYVFDNIKVNYFSELKFNRVIIFLYGVNWFLLILKVYV